MLDLKIFALVILMLFVATIALALIPCESSDQTMCKRIGEALSLTTTYSEDAGCLADFDGVWVPLESLTVSK